MNIYEFKAQVDALFEQVESLEREFLLSNGWEEFVGTPNTFWRKIIGTHVYEYRCRAFAVHTESIIQRDR